MTIIERYCSDHGIPYDPRHCPCYNLVENEPKEHSGCPFACRLDPTWPIDPFVCERQMDSIGSVDESLITLDEINLLQSKLLMLHQQALAVKPEFGGAWEKAILHHAIFHAGVSFALGFFGLTLGETDCRVWRQDKQEFLKTQKAEISESENPGSKEGSTT